jgi:gliding motility-associated-like protein
MPVVMVMVVGLIMGSAATVNAQQKINNLIFNSTENILGLNFTNAASPQPFYTGISANASIGEGIAHAEDGDGNIIFWVNASGVYDRDNQLMPGSAGILAHPSATEIIICPLPGAPEKYYIFYNNQLCSQLFYSLVDMSQRNGLGTVVQLNRSIAPSRNFAEGLEVVRIPCSRNYWLLAYECERGISRFLVDETGVSGGDIIHAFSTNGHGGRGELDYHKGKLGYAITFRNQALVGDFNPETGQLSEVRTLSFPSANGAYGLEFSPDASKLYVSDLNNLNIFGQPAGHNLFSYDFATGLQQAWRITNSNPNCSAQMEGLGHIEQGKDGNLYVSQLNGCQIVVIENPDSATPLIRKINVNTVLSAGISDHIQSDFLDQDLLSEAKILAEEEDFLCQGTSAVLLAKDHSPGRHYQWYRNGSTLANARDYRLRVTEAGEYSVSITNNAGCSITSGEFILEDASIPPLSFQRYYESCQQDPLQLNTNITGYSVHWQHGAEGPTVGVQESGRYYLSISNGRCSRPDSIDVVLHRPLPYRVPNVITPNGDGKNDTFEIRELQESISLQIYNRWGKLVWASADYQNDWTGRELAQGTYFYRIASNSGCSPRQTGWVLVMWEE